MVAIADALDRVKSMANSATVNLSTQVNAIPGKKPPKNKKTSICVDVFNDLMREMVDFDRSQLKALPL